jgi:5-methylcytosine-specific restriction endonuclease McrA
MARACILYGPKCSDGGRAVPGTSRCKAHTNSNWGRSKHPYSSVYKDQRWTDLRKRVLREEPTCAVEGCHERSTSVDHIVSLANGGDPFDRSNLRGMCYPHHKEAIEPARSRGAQTQDGPTLNSVPERDQRVAIHEAGHTSEGRLAWPRPRR